MAGGGCVAQVPVVAFEDVVVVFSPREWAELEEWQQELYQDVMAENYQLVSSLECLLSIPELLCRLAHGEAPCISKPPQPARKRDSSGRTSHASCCSEEPRRKRGRAASGVANEAEEEEGEGSKEAQEEAVAAVSVDTVRKAHLRPARAAGKHSRKRPVSQDGQRLAGPGTGQVPQDGSHGQRPRVREKPFKCPKCQRRFLGLIALTAHRRLHVRKWPRIRSPGVGSSSHKTPDPGVPPEGPLGARASPFPCSPGEGPFPFWPEMALQQQQPQPPSPHGFNPWALGFGPQALAGPQAPGLHSNGEFICDQCGWSFHGWEELVTHQMAHMAAEGIAGSVPKAGALAQLAADRPYTCNQCGKSFRHKPNLLAHRQVHTGERRYQCQECGKSFGSKAYLASHQHIHTGEKPFVCSQCGKSFRHKPNLISHQKIHSREPLPQSPSPDAFNGEAFRSPRPPLLVDPLGTESFRGTLAATHPLCGQGDGPLPPLPGILPSPPLQLAAAIDRPFVCPICTKPFRCKPYLVAHLRIHTGEKPYACSRCPKRFSQKSNLVSHERLHTGEKPYACPLCPRVFSQGSNMRAHQRSHRNLFPSEVEGGLPHGYTPAGQTQPSAN